MSSVTTTHVLGDNVIRFCERHNLLAHLDTALRLADETFQPIERLTVGIEPDPEVEEDTVVIDIWIRGSVEEGLARKAAFTHQWIATVPPAVVGQIVLLYYLI